jgi:radical SAM-linked protein
VDRPTETAPGTAPTGPPREPRQRWRLTYARDPVPPEAVGRALIEAWQAALVTSRLPVAGLEPGGPARARLSIAAPLPAPAAGEAELADLFLLERRQLWQVREALGPCLPPGHRWIGAEDVWLGAPPLPGRVAAADWRIEVTGASDAPDGLATDRLRRAVMAILAAPELLRVRTKGGSEKRYDLRPLLADVAVDGDDVATLPGRTVIRVRTRIHPELGSGRPEEVVGAIGEEAGMQLESARIVRTRIVLADDLAREGSTLGR